MVIPWLRRALLSALLGLGIATGFARADGNSPAPQPTVIQFVTQPPAPAQAETTTTAKAHPVRDKFYSHLTLGCWSHHNGFGCGSLHAETVFIFGSCRAFFGESCLKEPPADPLAAFQDGSADGGHLAGTRSPGCRCR